VDGSGDGALGARSDPEPSGRLAFRLLAAGYEAWVLFVDDRGYVQEYTTNGTDRAARELRNYEFRRSHADSEYFESLCAALDAEGRYIAHATGQGSVPFAQPFAVTP